MIFFGTRGVKSTKEQGQFMCPQCATEQPYKHKKVTRFFTLYFIPLIPLGSAGEYVECQTCKGTFVTRVLEYEQSQDKNEFQAIYEKAMRHCMILMMLADGEIDDNEMLVVQTIINKFGHCDISMDELKVLVDIAERQAEPVHTYLSKVTASLNEHGKETIIKCALAVASADGNIDQSELDLINKMATTMEMSSSHLKGIFADMAEKKGAFSEN